MKAIKVISGNYIKFSDVKEFGIEEYDEDVDEKLAKTKYFILYYPYGNGNVYQSFEEFSTYEKAEQCILALFRNN